MVHLEKTSYAHEITSQHLKHPALLRVKSKLLAEKGTASIERYDRMHHRHNRT